MVGIKTNLEGERVLIRRLRLSDANDVYLNVRDKEVVRWTLNIPYPYPKETAAKFIRRSQRTWRAKKGFDFGVILKETGRVIGVTGLKNVDHKSSCAEIGYWLGKNYWRRGLATEAVRLVLKFGFKELKLHRIYAHTFEKNIASRQVLEKCGFRIEGIMREALFKQNRRHNMLNYGILKREFQNV